MIIISESLTSILACFMSSVAVDCHTTRSTWRSQSSKPPGQRECHRVKCSRVGWLTSEDEGVRTPVWGSTGTSLSTSAGPVLLILICHHLKDALGLACQSESRRTVQCYRCLLQERSFIGNPRDPFLFSPWGGPWSRWVSQASLSQPLDHGGSDATCVKHVPQYTTGTSSTVVPSPRTVAAGPRNTSLEKLIRE